MRGHYPVVVIGTSAGGIAASKFLLQQLPAVIDYSIIIVQHLPSDCRVNWPELLNQRVALPVKEAWDGEPLQRGNCYFAPAGYHLLLEQDLSFSLSVDAKVQCARPSIDVLFESAASALKQQLAGIILTGANSDGSAGLACIKAQGGLAIVQQPEQAYSPDMPRAAINATEVDQILTLEQIAQFLRENQGATLYPQHRTDKESYNASSRNH